MRFCVYEGEGLVLVGFVVGFVGFGDGWCGFFDNFFFWSWVVVLDYFVVEDFVYCDVSDFGGFGVDLGVSVLY